MGQGLSLKSKRKNPWFKPWFNILMHTQLIVCATVYGQCLEYLVYITLPLPTPLKNAHILNGWFLRENKLEYWLTKIALANGVAWRIGVAWALFKVSVTTFEDTTISVEVTVWLPSSDVIKYVNVLYSVLITLVGCICPACIMEKRNKQDIRFIL